MLEYLKQGIFMSKFCTNKLRINCKATPHKDCRHKLAKSFDVLCAMLP